jgi:hypothetical protein
VSSNSGERVEGWEPAVIDPFRGITEGAKPVWVRLDALMIRNPGKPIRQNSAGIDMTGEVPGMLRQWIPTGKGDWMGVVHLTIRYVDGRQPLNLDRQLVPDYALRPRESGTTER